jgi:hypothetical protein
MSELRNQIRSAAMANKKSFRNIEVNVNGVKIEVRQLSMFKYSVLREKAHDNNGNFDSIKYVVNAIIASSYVPGENVKVFEDTDFDAISHSLENGDVDKIWTAVEELMDYTLKDAKKN